MRCLELIDSRLIGGHCLARGSRSYTFVSLACIAVASPAKYEIYMLDSILIVLGQYKIWLINGFTQSI